MISYEDLICEAKKLAESDKIQEAIEKYEEAFNEQIKPEDLVDLGLLYLEVYNYSQARECFSSLINEFEEFPRAYYGLGLIEEELGNIEKALEYYERASSQDEKYEEANIAVAYLSEELGDYEKAIDYYQRALVYNPDNYWINVNISSVYERLNENDIALTYAQKAKAISPKEKMASYNLGVIYAKLGKFEEAKQSYLEELETKFPFPGTYLNLGLLYKDQFNDQSSALYYYSLGLSKNKENVNLWYNLGCLYALMGKYPDAKECLLCSIVKNPKNLQVMNEDDELKDFRESKEYKELIEATKDLK